jgi:hypothetical protein
MNLPDLKKPESGKFINCVLGYTKINPEIKPEVFTLSNKDGCLEYGDIQFFPKIIKEFDADDEAYVFIQAYFPSGIKKTKPEFFVAGKDNQVHLVSFKLKAETWTNNGNIWNSLFSLDLSPSSSGENTFFIEVPVPEGNSVLSQKMNLTFTGEDSPVEEKGKKDLREEEVRKKDISPELDQILKGSDEYCRKIADSVLDIVCEEKITEKVYSIRNNFMSFISRKRSGVDPPSSRDPRVRTRSRRRVNSKNEYVYDYQLVRKGWEIKEQRILIKENGKKRNTKNPELKTRFRHEYMIMGPLALLREKRQPYHDYRIIGEKKLWGRKAIIIEAVPKQGYSFEHLGGKIWVDRENFNILKIEWNQKSIQGYKLLNKNVSIDFATEYKFEKNGIRFPSQYA